MVTGFKKKSSTDREGEQSCENAVILKQTHKQTNKHKKSHRLILFLNFSLFTVPGRGVPTRPVSLAVTASLKGHP